MALKLQDSVVVITGASSGIGRAAALKFAEKGAKVAVIARRAEALDSLATEIQRRGGQAMALRLDVRSEEAVQEAARLVVERFGRIDVWVNNAGVSLFASLEEAPMELFRGVIETNLLGYVHGARAVLPVFRTQGQGVLINNASLQAHIGSPYVSSYVASKFAIRGWAESLRQELRGTGISVCTIKPGSIDTPFFAHAANFTGRAIKPLNPKIDVDRVARAMVTLARFPRREVFVGHSARLLALQHTLAPGLTERIVDRLVRYDHFSDEPAAPSPGAVLEPMPQGTTADGGWKRRKRERATNADAQAPTITPAVGGA